MDSSAALAIQKSFSTYSVQVVIGQLKATVADPAKFGLPKSMEAERATANIESLEFRLLVSFKVGPFCHWVLIASLVLPQFAISTTSPEHVIMSNANKEEKC